MEDRSQVTLRGSSSQTYDFEDVDSYALEIGEFAECLRSGTRPVRTEREGIDVLCLILAAYEGARIMSPQVLSGLARCCPLLVACRKLPVVCHRQVIY
jgi:hypothetical protein